MADMDVMNCQGLAVPVAVMRHVVDVESAFNPYAIGVVGGRLLRQPVTLQEAIATARMLESRGFNFSLGLAQVNRHNLAKYGLSSYSMAFEACPNLRAGSRILADCHVRSGYDWGRSLSCYYSGNFTDGFHDGYVQKVFASIRLGEHTTHAAPRRATPLVASAAHRNAANRSIASSFGPAQRSRISLPTERAASQLTNPLVMSAAVGADPLVGGAKNQPMAKATVDLAGATAAEPPALVNVDTAFVF